MNAFYPSWFRTVRSIRLAKPWRMPSSALFWVLATVMPIVVAVSTSVWLRTAYTGGVFHLGGFIQQYNNGIFRYRILGRELILFIYRHLLLLRHDQPLAMPRDPDATLLFYGSYVLLNTVCFALSNFLLLLLLSDNQRIFGDRNLATYFYLTLIQVLATAVVSPYDQLAYLFLLLSFAAAMIPRRWISLTAVVSVAVAGTLTRETQYLATPALLTVALFSRAPTANRFRSAGLSNLAVFGIVYIVLRIVIPGQNVVTGGRTWGGEWAIESAVALTLLFAVNTALILRSFPDLRPTLTILALSAPYILTILTSGVLRELRLLVPLLLIQSCVYVQLAAGKDANSDTQTSHPSAGSPHYNGTHGNPELSAKERRRVPSH